MYFLSTGMSKRRELFYGKQLEGTGGLSFGESPGNAVGIRGQPEDMTV